MTQQGDVLLFQTNDDGEIEIAEGLVTMSGGLGTAAYLSLFGANDEDDGRKNNALTWWGNLIEALPERQYRSETQFLLRSIPPIPANLLRVQQAAERDLAWFTAVGAATGVSVVATMPGLNLVRLVVQITGEGLSESFEYVENWRADAA